MLGALAIAAIAVLAVVSLAVRGTLKDDVDTIDQLDGEAAITLPTFAPTAAATVSGRSPTSSRAPALASATTRLRDESGLPVVTVAQLPKEAQRVLQLIESGGPYEYDRDGITFENREGLLPKQPRGYYKEYTVKTPGENDRGARRIVAGQKRERDYTADNYDSFVSVKL